MSTTTDLRNSMLAALNDASQEPWATLAALADLANEEGDEEKAWAWRWLLEQRREPQQCDRKNAYRWGSEKDCFSKVGIVSTSNPCCWLPHWIYDAMNYHRIPGRDIEGWPYTIAGAYWLAVDGLLFWKEKGFPELT